MMQRGEKIITIKPRGKQEERESRAKIEWFGIPMGSSSILMREEEQLRSQEDKLFPLLWHLFSK